MIINYYISPHLDDAALSCGGLIARQVAEGEKVRVINLFAGIPHYAEHEFSPYAQKQHSKWQLKPQEAVLARRQEDQHVIEALGAERENWHYYDAIYRASEQEFLYTDHQKLFGPVHPAEYSLIEQLVQQLEQLRQDAPNAVFYAPLWVGGHVDHLIARNCAIQLRNRGGQIVFYEDFPYVGRENWQDEPTTVEKAKKELPFQVKIQLVPIDATAKIKALMGYRSQLFSLFGDWEGKGLANEVYHYTAKVGREAGFADGWFEQYWYPC